MANEQHQNWRGKCQIDEIINAKGEGTLNAYIWTQGGT